MNHLGTMMDDLSLLRRFDAACDQFEAAWRRGHQPQLENYLRLFPAEERSTLLELLQQLQQELITRDWPHAPTEMKPSASRPPRENRSMNSPEEDAFREATSPTRIIPAGKNVDDERQVQLQVIEGPHKDLSFTYSEHDTLLVGRSPQAQFRLKDDPRVSRHHFRLEMNPPSCYLLDLNSSNGTHVNGQRIAEAFLKNGDIISVGRTKLAVRLPLAGRGRSPSEPVPAAPPPLRNPENTPAAPLPQSNPSLPLTSEIHGIADGKFPEIPGYAIQKQIRQGEFGTVYGAIRTSNGEPCTVKVIQSERDADPRALQSFLREASILGQLQHPHMIRMLEMGQHQANLYMSMEHFPAVGWDRLSESWSVEKRIRISCGMMVQLLSALHFAHSRGMVHRDIKPENVLIARMGTKLVAKLTDFGLAKQYTSAGLSQMTRNGDVVGSIAYMAPEQFINSRDAKPAADLYSAAATLFWMITGQSPICFEKYPCKFLALLEEPPTALASLCAQAPVALGQWIQRSLDKSPEARFHSAAEMQQQLRSILKSITPG